MSKHQKWSYFLTVALDFDSPFYSIQRQSFESTEFTLESLISKKSVPKDPQKSQCIKSHFLYNHAGHVAKLNEVILTVFLESVIDIICCT